MGEGKLSSWGRTCALAKVAAGVLALSGAAVLAAVAAVTAAMAPPSSDPAVLDAFYDNAHRHAADEVAVGVRALAVHGNERETLYLEPPREGFWLVPLTSGEVEAELAAELPLACAFVLTRPMPARLGGSDFVPLTVVLLVLFSIVTVLLRCRWRMTLLILLPVALILFQVLPRALEPASGAARQATAPADDPSARAVLIESYEALLEEAKVHGVADAVGQHEQQIRDVFSRSPRAAAAFPGTFGDSELLRLRFAAQEPAIPLWCGMASGAWEAVCLASDTPYAVSGMTLEFITGLEPGAVDSKSGRGESHAEPRPVPAIKALATDRWVCYPPVYRLLEGSSFLAQYVAPAGDVTGEASARSEVPANPVFRSPYGARGTSRDWALLLFALIVFGATPLVERTPSGAFRALVLLLVLVAAFPAARACYRNTARAHPARPDVLRYRAEPVAGSLAYGLEINPASDYRDMTAEQARKAITERAEQLSPRRLWESSYALIEDERGLILRYYHTDYLRPHEGALGEPIDVRIVCRD